MLLRYSTPYDWPMISGWLRARAIEGVERVEEDAYVRGGVVVRHDADRQGVWCAPPARLQATRLFDLGADPHAIRKTFSRDPLLAPRIRKRPGVRVPGAWDPFELAVRAIVGQQVSVAAARTILGRIAASPGIVPERLAEVSIEGMPRKRAETIRLLARWVLDCGGIAAAFESGGDAAALQKIPGIGPWTANYIAMRLGDRDAFPAGDLILRRMAGNLTERELLRHAEAWRPFRAYGAMLLWTTTAT
ncbi:MAG TPA: AlkA N-terminal domain-containing protein [Thermoanaerobaculia bacterium]|nr:AlkA N-terminal domain-containing protein [Thermoanaerobaculia bacterium]